MDGLRPFDPTVRLEHSAGLAGSHVSALLRVWVVRQGLCPCNVSCGQRAGNWPRGLRFFVVREVNDSCRQSLTQTHSRTSGSSEHIRAENIPGGYLCQQNNKASFPAPPITQI